MVQLSRMDFVRGYRTMSEYQLFNNEKKTSFFFNSRAMNNLIETIFEQWRLQCNAMRKWHN